jgi:hypothetical protein
MKILATSIFSLVIGFGLGWYFGYARPNAEANRDAIRWFGKSDDDDSMAAAIAYRTFKLYDAGETQKAMQKLAWPIGVYYRYNKTRTLTADGSNFLAKIEQLASSNKVVAAEIHRTIE